MKKHLVLLLILAFFGKAYVNAQVVTGANIVNYQAKAIDTNPQMFIVPIVASIEVIKGAMDVYSTSAVIKLPANGVNGKPAMSDKEYMAYLDKSVNRRIEELKSQVLFEFSEKTGADLILSPMYSITTDNSDGLVVNVTIKVKGYPAKYTKFREMTENDTKLVSTAGMVEENMESKVLKTQSLTNTEKETIVEK